MLQTTFIGTRKVQRKTSAQYTSENFANIEEAWQSNFMEIILRFRNGNSALTYFIHLFDTRVMAEQIPQACFITIYGLYCRDAQRTTDCNEIFVDIFIRKLFIRTIRICRRIG